MIDRDPENLEAWLWIARLVGDAHQKERCYKEVLQIAPDNLEAKEFLESAGQSYKHFTTATPTPEPLQGDDRKKSSHIGRYKYLVHITMDVLFIIWVYYGLTSKSELIGYAILSMIVYGFIVTSMSGFARRSQGCLKTLSGTKSGCINLLFALLVIGALAPIIDLIYSLFGFLTYTDDETG